MNYGYRVSVKSLRLVVSMFHTPMLTDSRNKQRGLTFEKHSLARPIRAPISQDFGTGIHLDTSLLTFTTEQVTQQLMQHKLDFESQ
jgi:hypothetical protein